MHTYTHIYKHINTQIYLIPVCCRHSERKRSQLLTASSVLSILAILTHFQSLFLFNNICSFIHLRKFVKQLSHCFSCLRCIPRLLNSPNFCLHYMSSEFCQSLTVIQWVLIKLVRTSTKSRQINDFYLGLKPRKPHDNKDSKIQKCDVHAKPRCP